MMKRLLILIFGIISLNATAEMVDTFQFNSPAERSRAVELAKSLRCPQCQNQNLVESNSPIAYDLRLEVYKMVQDGKTNQQIIDTMTNRFGDFVNYNPPLRLTTVALWFLPVILLLGSLGSVWFYIYKPSLTTPNSTAMPQTAPKDPLDKSKLSNLANRSNVANLSIVKINILILALLIIFPVGYYFSLDRLDYVKKGEQLQISHLNQQIETSEESKTNQRISQLQNELRQDPNHAQNWLKLGDSYMQNDDFSSALVCYENAEKINGENATTQGLIAMALYLKNNQQITPEVQKYLANALKLDPKEVSALSLLVAEDFKHQNYIQARDYLQQILDSGNPAVDRRATIQKIKMIDFIQKGEMQ